MFSFLTGSGGFFECCEETSQKNFGYWNIPTLQKQECCPEPSESQAGLSTFPVPKSTVICHSRSLGEGKKVTVRGGCLNGPCKVHLGEDKPHTCTGPRLVPRRIWGEGMVRTREPSQKLPVPKGRWTDGTGSWKEFYTPTPHAGALQNAGLGTVEGLSAREMRADWAGSRLCTAHGPELGSTRACFFWRRPKARIWILLFER